MHNKYFKFHFLLAFVALYFCGCKAYKIFTYKITNVSFSNCDNTGRRPHDLVGDSVAAAAYAIRMEFTGTIFMQDNGKDVQGENRFVLGHQLVGFKVYSTTDFDATHPAYSSLNDRFYYLKDTVGYFPDTILSNYSITSVFFDSWKSNSDPVKTSSYLLLMYPSAMLGPRTIKIDMVYSDSAKFSGTLPVNLY